MECDLLEPFRKDNHKLFMDGHITVDEYFEQDILNDYLKELYIINLN